MIFNVEVCQAFTRVGGPDMNNPGLDNVEPGLFRGKAGDGLLSHPLSRAVPSALRGLTAVFGMGTGVALSR